MDPLTAFALAQGAVKGIKAALQLGKVASSLYKEFSTFFQASDAVHMASAKLRMDSVGKSDAQLSDQALQIALASKALRDSEKQLKDMLVWSGNAPVWEEMMRERIRLMKDRNSQKKLLADAAYKKKKEIADIILNISLFMSTLVFLAAMLGVALQTIIRKQI